MKEAEIRYYGDGALEAIAVGDCIYFDHAGGDRYQAEDPTGGRFDVSAAQGSWGEWVTFAKAILAVDEKRLRGSG